MFGVQAPPISARHSVSGQLGGGAGERFLRSLSGMAGTPVSIR